MCERKLHECCAILKFPRCKRLCYLCYWTLHCIDDISMSMLKFNLALLTVQNDVNCVNEQANNSDGSSFIKMKPPTRYWMFQNVDESFISGNEGQKVYYSMSGYILQHVWENITACLGTHYSTSGCISQPLRVHIAACLGKYYSMSRYTLQHVWVHYSMSGYILQHFLVYILHVEHCSDSCLCCDCSMAL